MGIGRIGGIVGPVPGGVAVSAGTSVPHLFLLTGAASLCAGVAGFAMTRAAAPGGRKERSAAVLIVPSAG